MSREYDLALEALREVWALHRRFEEEGPPEILDDSGKDYKISADVESERVILEVLRAGSGHPVLSEEAGLDSTGTMETLWVVDPLDGSANFLRGLPLYCVAIGLVRTGEPHLGMIMDGRTGRVYTGILGEGAWSGTLEDPKASEIRVSSVGSPGKAVLATGLPVSRGFDEAALMGFLPWFQQFKKIRMFGTASMSLAFLASGAVDAYGEDEIKIWDVAAGIALVRAAGGHVQMVESRDVEHAFRVRAASTPGLWARVGP